MLRQACSGIVSYHFESLAGGGLVHAVFSRLGGVSRGPFCSLNVGHSVGDDPEAVAENHRRIYAHLRVTAGQVTTGRQVHGNHVAVIGQAEAGQVLPGTDGLVTRAKGIALMLRFADCQPILLVDPVNHALGLAHAGWRGIAQGIARRTVEAMTNAFGSEPENLLAGLGPAVGPCCYIVGDEVAAAMGYALPHWRRAVSRTGDHWRLDITAANAQQLAAAGVCSIEPSNLCTACQRDEFYSHRGEEGRTGRFAAVAYLVPGASHDDQDGSAQPRPPTDQDGSDRTGSLQAPGLPSLGERGLSG